MPGLDEELEVGTKTTTETQEAEKPKRRPFHYWNVGGVEHKMKLNTSMITKLESKYHTNLIALIADGDVPPLSIMLTVTQAAIAPWEHNTSYANVEAMYESYVEAGGNMSDFYKDVIMPTLAVSGFFTDSAVESILAEIHNADILS